MFGLWFCGGEDAYVAAAGSSGGSPVVFMGVCHGCNGVGWTVSWWNFGFRSSIRSLGGFVALDLILCLGVGGWVIFELESPLGCSLFVPVFGSGSSGLIKIRVVEVMLVL